MVLKAVQARLARPVLLLEWLPVLAGLLALYVPAFFDLARTHWTRDEHAHGPIIVAIVIWLFWGKRHILLAAPHVMAVLPGVSLLAFGLVFYVVGRAHKVIAFEIGSLPLVLAGTLLAMRGWSALRASWFILLFVAYLVPLPGAFVDALTLPMKQAISEMAADFLFATGYPVARDGVVLMIGQYHLLVDDACAGINSMFSLSAVGLLYLYLVGRKSWIHNGLILASLVPIAFGANVVRVIILVLITYLFGDEAGQSFVHALSGLLLFGIAFGAVLVLDGLLVKTLKQ
jgi:exosortase B